MKYIKQTLILIGCIFLVASNAFSDDDWRDDFISALEKGKAVQLPEGDAQTEGLAYTPPEDVVLEEAIAKAIERKAPACECMKIAIDFDYNPYSVLKNIYSAGGQVGLNELCMCATEAGVMKAVIAKAAMDAVTPLNEPVYDRDEIAQSQCLGGEEILAYTALTKPLPRIPVTDTNKKDASRVLP